MTTPRIWAGSWLDYNSGRLHGRWIDCDRGADHIHSEIEAMLAESPEAATAFSRRWGIKAEEYGVFDHEGFGEYRVGEQPDIEEVAEVAAAIVEHGAPFKAWLGNEQTVDPAAFQDAYLGHYESPADYAREHYAEAGLTGDLERLWFAPGPGEKATLKAVERLLLYVDWERVARDMGYNGVSFVRMDGHPGVFVFAP